MMAECDTLLMIGSGFPWAEFLPEEGQARGVQIDLAPEMLSLRYPMEVPLQGESAETLRALLPLLKQKAEGGSWRKGIEKGVAPGGRRRGSRDGEGQPGEPAAGDLGTLAADARPRHHHLGFGLLCQLVRPRPEDAARPDVLALGWPRFDGGGGALRYRRKVAHPDRPVIALVGDGAMQMNNMAELITVSKYMHRWPNKTWICCVFNNEDLNQVTWEQRVMEATRSSSEPDDPERALSQVRRADRAARHLRRRSGADGAAWDEALASPVPVVLEVKTDRRCRRCRRSSPSSR